MVALRYDSYKIKLHFKFLESTILQFRSDINGLRAIAVIGVVLFHFNASWMSGGFAGVDVFFVISGFLMTGIIFREIEKEKFSVLKFYIARANRIIPALAVLCIVLLVFGWFYLTPFGHRDLGKHVGSSIGFFSNIIYMGEAGYFDAASHKKWLLHTWSLSVEWQFYIVYPLVLVVMRKFMPVKTMKATVLLGTVLGFIYCIIVTYKWPNAAYYLLPTRAWEMMIGGVAYLYPLALKEERKKLVERFGFVLIIGSYLFISKETPWPGYLAIFPVLGSFLIIQGQRNDSFITSNIISQKIGAWSYSIYLWHWPIVVAIYYFSLNEMFIYLGIVLSVLLGFLSNKFIENIKFRVDFGHLSSYLKCKPLYMALFVGVLGGGNYAYINYRFINLPDVEKYDVAQSKYGYCFTGAVGFLKNNTSCLIGNIEKKANVLIFGDSFLGHYEPLLQKVALELDISMLSLTSASCFPSFSNSDYGKVGNAYIAQCLMNRKFAKKHIDDFDTIILSVRWDAFRRSDIDYSNEVYEFVNYLVEKGKNVIFLPAPTIFHANIGEKYKETLLSDDEFDIKNYLIDESNNHYNIEKSRELLVSIPTLENFISIPKSLLYPEDTFDHKGNNIPYSADGGHISILGAERMLSTIKNNGVYDRIKPLLIQ